MKAAWNEFSSDLEVGKLAAWSATDARTHAALNEDDVTSVKNGKTNLEPMTQELT